MKRYIRSSAQFGKGWTQEDIDIWNSVDWAARNYEPYVVEDDTFVGTATLYGIQGGPLSAVTEFVRVIRANPIYAPSYVPNEIDPFNKKDRRGRPTYVGPMFDGRYKNGVKVMDRYETQDLYDLSAD